MQEQSLPLDIGFAPWTPGTGSRSTLSAAAKQLLHQVATSEINQDYNAQTNLDSMYFSGKALAKFGMIVYTTHDILGEPDLATLGLNQLKSAFAVFSTNQQIHPLVYDTVWNGVVSSGSYVTGDPLQDFGNTFYNDHHFHYGYFIYTAAVIAYLDPSWLSLNKDWVNTLVRDAANPSIQDNLFPFSRMFDFYHGHSFAKGLFESADSKDEESTSEDTAFAYGMKMWGHVIGDASMEARGNLMLSILARTLDSYFLLSSDNTNQPANFIGNKVTGIVSPIPPSIIIPTLSKKNPRPLTHYPTHTTALRKQSRPHHLLRLQPRIHPRRPHAAPEPFQRLNPQTQLRCRGMERLLQRLVTLPGVRRRGRLARRPVRQPSERGSEDELGVFRAGGVRRGVVGWRGFEDVVFGVCGGGGGVLSEECWGKCIYR